MTNFSWIKAISFGIGIWAIGGAALWLIAQTSLSAGWAHGLVAIVIGISAYLFALNANSADYVSAIAYGVVFAVVGMGLDAVITRVFDAHIFTTWQYYLGYALAVLAPTLTVQSRSQSMFTT